MQTGLGGQNLAPNQMYHQMPGQNMNNHAAVDNLTDSFGNINLRNTTSVGQGKDACAGPALNGQTANALLGQQHVASMLYQLPDGTFVPGNYQHYTDPYSISLSQPRQYQQAYNGVLNNNIPNGPHTPRNHAWITSQNMHQIPELRRSSLSSNEEASPQTPLDGYQPTVVFNHSPPTWDTTPSPIQAQHPYNQQVAKDRDGVPMYLNFWAWTQQEPSIPPPVPAMYSGPDGGRGSLDKILDNRNGTTNVYIRGLQPNTTDEMLGGYGRRFGPIVSQKAIVEMSNPKLCKG